jgi:hypothetical protein
MRWHVTIFGIVAAVALQISLLPAAAGQWLTERESELGFAFSYPAELFQEIEGDGKPSFHYFASPSSDAKFLVGGWNNQAAQSPERFKQWLIANAGGYDDATYRPRGRSWFVLSGYRGDKIYYEKVMFSCRGRLVNVFAITYPVAERDLFDPIVERMEDTFRPGRRCS